LQQAARLLKPGGRAIASFPNLLHGLFRLDHRTAELFCDHLLAGDTLPDEDSRASVLLATEGLLQQPKDLDHGGPQPQGYREEKLRGSNALTPLDLSRRRYNPLAPEEWTPSGLRAGRMLFYGLTPFPPALDAVYPALFREGGRKLEAAKADWRHYFMGRFFMVELLGPEEGPA
jgi:hypothetical protein